MKSKFKLKNKFSTSDLQLGTIDHIPTSDLTLQGENGDFYQFDFVENQNEITKLKIKPGIYSFIRQGGEIKLIKTDLVLPELLETIDNTAKIKKEIETFFNKLEVYEKLKLPPKRAILLYGPPGTSKTTSINKSIIDMQKKDKNSVAFIWPTSVIEAYHIKQLLTFGVEYDKKIKKQIIIMEDIGGTTHEGNSGPRHTDPELLNLLDGIGHTFKVPTFMMATTNFPQNLLESLADRPGRFDEMIEMAAPPKEQKLQLLEFMLKRVLTEEEKLSFDGRTEYFSISHIREIVVRSMLHDKSIPQIVREMLEHRERFEKGFDGRSSKFGIV